jgi:hypothetical protein
MAIGKRTPPGFVQLNKYQKLVCGQLFLGEYQDSEPFDIPEFCRDEKSA